MPRPMSGPMSTDDDAAGPAPAARVLPDGEPGRSPEQDSRGRPLALVLPDWDLLPPTEFLQRHPGR